MSSIYFLVVTPELQKCKKYEAAHKHAGNTHLNTVRPGSFYGWGACRGAQNLNLLLPSFSRQRETVCWKERCGRGNDWLRMEEERERKGEEEIDIRSGRRRMEKGKREWKTSEDWFNGRF